jgi:PAS domain S-box-containing protein
MSIQTKLWIGFGVLLSILVLTVLGATVWMRDLRGSLHQITEKVEPESTAAFEMHLSVANTALAVSNYLQSGAAGHRERIARELEDFRQSHARYEHFTRDDPALARQVASVFDQFVARSQSLLDASDRQRVLMSAISEDLVLMLQSIDVALEVTPTRAPQRRALRNMQVGLAEVGTWLGSYWRTWSDDDLARMLDAEQRFLAARFDYNALPLKPAEIQWARQALARSDDLLAQAHVATQLRALEEESLRELALLQLRLDVLLEQGVQTRARSELAAAAGVADAAIDRILLSTVLLLLAGVMLSAATGVLVSRAVVRAEQTLRVTLASIGDAVIATDAEGRVTFLNRVAETLTGWSHAEAISRPLAQVFRLMSEATREPMENVVASALRLNRVLSLTEQAVLMSRDGSERPIDDSAAPIHDDQGRAVGVVLVFRDASQRRAEERKLREADRRKDEFLAMLSHELRNPLAPLRNGLYVLQSPGVDAAMRDRILQMMMRQVQGLTRMIDDLLDVARVTSGKIELRIQPLDLADLVSRVAEVHRPASDAGGRALAVSVPAEPLIVNADPTRIEQVIDNLLGNAVKCTQRGGHVWLDVDAEEGVAVVRVRDDGIGLDPDKLHQVFDLFAQVDSTPARSQGGLGIGLTLVREVVEMHGGRVSARSAGLGQGSEFTVELPRVTATRPEKGGPVPVEPPPPASRILVVDDNVDSADSLALLLRLRGHDAYALHDGRAVLDTATSLSPHLILLDIGLPEMDGYEVASRLRGLPAFAGTVVVAMTGYGQPEDRLRSHAAGFHHHLVKPVDIGTIESLLRPAGAEGLPPGRDDPAE